MPDMTTDAVESARRSPGRPRSARADEAIIEAVLDLLEAGTAPEALSIEAVAARAGVGKATIYRRWANKDALLLDAVRALKGPPAAVRGESVREDLLILVGAITRSADPRTMTIMPCLIPELHRSPAQYRLFQEMAEPRREAMREVLRRGVRTGELRADLDVELALMMLTAPPLIQKMLRWNPRLDEESLAERLVDAVLGGLAGKK